MMQNEDKKRDQLNRLMDAARFLLDISGNDVDDEWDEQTRNKYRLAQDTIEEIEGENNEE